MNEADLKAEVSAWLTAGATVPEIERRLKERGLKPEEASEVVDAVLAGQTSATAAKQRRRDRLLLLGGIALCGLGVLCFVAGILEANMRLFAGSAATFGSGVALIIRAVV